MPIELWLANELGSLAVVFFLHYLGVIEVELWMPKWLSDSVQDLPDAGSFYE